MKRRVEKSEIGQKKIRKSKKNCGNGHKKNEKTGRKNMETNRKML